MIHKIQVGKSVIYCGDDGLKAFHEAVKEQSKDWLKDNENNKEKA